MKPISYIFRSLALCLLVGQWAWAQPRAGAAPALPGKLFVAEVKGTPQIITKDRVADARQAETVDAPGTVIETDEKSQLVIVLSNGVSLFMGPNARVEIKRFEQQPFDGFINDTGIEPSMSQTILVVKQGNVALSGVKLVSGSSFVVMTPQASINVRSQELAIDVSPLQTTVYMMQGNATVQSSLENQPASQVVQAGPKAVITQDTPTKPPYITINNFDRTAAAVQLVNENLALATQGTKVVSFEVVGNPSSGFTSPDGQTTASGQNPGNKSIEGDNKNAGFTNNQEIIAHPVVPSQLPTNITVSPASLIPPGT